MLSIIKEKLFPDKPTAKELARAQRRSLQKQQRALDRELRYVASNEAAIKRSIRSECTAGRQHNAKALAKQVVSSRRAAEHVHKAKSALVGISARGVHMQSQQAMHTAMQTSVEAMARMNESMSPAEASAMARRYQQEMDKASIMEEITEDMLLEGSGDEGDEEADAIVNQTLEEIGLSMKTVVMPVSSPEAPMVARAADESVQGPRGPHDPGEAVAPDTLDELQRRMAALQRGAG